MSVGVSFCSSERPLLGFALPVLLGLLHMGVPESFL
jgi:hypothetical protein